MRLRLACLQLRPPHRHTFSDFFWGEEGAVHRLSGTDNPVFRSQADSLRTADAFPVVASLEGREATIGIASAVRRLSGGLFIQN